MNDNLRKLDALVFLTVISATAATPSSTAEGSRFIVPVGGTGDFAGQAGKVAVRTGGAWVFYTPVVGWSAFVLSSANVYRYNGAAWGDIETVQPYLDVSNTGSWTLPNGATWTIIQLFMKNVDSAAGWGTSTYKYTVPLPGVYIVEAMLRPVRTGTGAMPANTTLALGFGTAAGDGIDVVASTAPDLNEFTVLFSKPMRLTAGQQVCVFGKHSAASAIQFTYAQFKLVRVSA